MATYGEKLLAELAEARAALLKLTHVDYEPTQIRDILSTVGAKTEIFLKSVVLPGRNPRNTFEWFINELASVPIDQVFRDELHALRRKYNDAKHDPAIVIPLLDATQIVEEARTAIDEIVKKGVGSVAAVVNPHMQRVFWVAVWDHYAHGDSEVHVILPGESEHWLGPPTFDIIYVSISGWDSVAANLPLVGTFRSGRNLIPDSQYDAFNSDSDFLGAWVFEGDYRSLITTLAQHELRQDLIPGLNRHESSGSMILAFLLASVDVIGGVADPNNLSAEIIKQATSVYAVPADYRHSQYLADNLAEMYQKVPHAEWPRISGPVWMRESGYSGFAPTSRAKHPKYDIVVDQDYVVRMLWSHK